MLYNFFLGYIVIRLKYEKKQRVNVNGALSEDIRSEKLYVFLVYCKCKCCEICKELEEIEKFILLSFRE